MKNKSKVNESLKRIFTGVKIEPNSISNIDNDKTGQKQSISAKKKPKQHKLIISIIWVAVLLMGTILVLVQFHLLPNTRGMINVKTPTRIVIQPSPTITATLVVIPTPSPSPIAAPRTYYVDGTIGLDAYPGSINQPLKTIQKAVDTVKPGDTIFIRAGTYNENIKIARSGSPGKIIKLTNYPGEIVQINGGNNFAIYSSGSIGYWTFEGLKIKSNSQFTLRFGWFDESITNHITLKKNYINGAVFTVGNYQLIEDNEIDGSGYKAKGGYGGINDSHGGLGDNATHHNTYRQNYIHDFTNENARGIWTQGRTHDNVIESNRIENIWTSGLGQCIDLDGAQSGFVQWRQSVKKNTIKDCSYVGIQLENVFASTIEDNFIKEEKGGNAGIIIINYDSTIGCGVGGESNQYGDIDGNNSCKGNINNSVIQQNIISNIGSWAWGYGGIVNWGAGGLKIINNTIYASGSGGSAAINFQEQAVNSGQAIIQNNILFNGNGPAICALSFDSFAQDSHNLLYKTNSNTVYGIGTDCVGVYSLVNYSSVTGKGENSIQSEPLLISPTSFDFHLKDTSPAIDQGTSVDLNSDFDGNPRPQGSGFDIGAYEFIQK